MSTSLIWIPQSILFLWLITILLNRGSESNDSLQSRRPRRLRVRVRTEGLLIVEPVRPLAAVLGVVSRIEEVEDFAGDLHIAAAAEADALADLDPDDMHVWRSGLALSSRWIEEADARSERVRLPHPGR